MEKLSIGEGAVLVKTARRMLEDFFAKKRTTADGELFRQKRGLFLSLHTFPEKRRRACLGHVLPKLVLEEALRNLAVSVVFEDSSNHVKKHELERLVVGVTLLGELEPVPGEKKNAPRHIEIGRHGVMVELHGFSGLFLPQVAPEQGWDAEETLAQACMKAGLEPSAWLDARARIFRFEGQAFEENKPRGEIIEKTP